MSHIESTPPDWRELCEELVEIATAHANPDAEAVGYVAATLTRARAALAEPGSNDYTVASDDTMRRIRSTTKRWRVSVIISTNDSAIDTRIGCGIWKCLDIEREILESVSLPECLPSTKENDSDH